MAYVDQKVIDTALNYVSTNASHLVVSSSTSDDYATLTGAELGRVAVSSGDFAITTDTSSAGGRTITLTANDVTITTAGTIKRLAIIDNTNNDALLIFTAEQERALVKNDVVKPDGLQYSISKGI